jgi:hypothetical protein
MKKTILIFTLLLSGAMSSYGQVATDFNVLDCSGNPHHLFAELDAGKVVVINWVMPCEFCIASSLDAYVAVNSFSTSHPGRVLYYLADDFADNTCQTLTAWGNNFGFTNCPKFSDAAISMDDYGGFGMPKIVVVGGNHHQVYFNKENSTAGIYAAINKALIGENTLGLEQHNPSGLTITTYPNPAVSSVNVTYRLNKSSMVRINVTDMPGRIVRTSSGQMDAGKHGLEFETSTLSNGIYFIEVATEFGKESTRFTVSH